MVLSSSGWRVGLQGAQLRHVLGRLPVHDLAVVQRGLHQHRRIRAALAGCRRASTSACSGSTLARPGLPHSRYSPDGERQRRVEHRVHHVDERHLRDHGPEQLGPQVGHRAHQQAARAAALDHEPFGRRVAAAHQRLGHRDEVGEGVLLAQQLARVVPEPAAVAAAAHVGDREDHPAVEQRHARGAEVRVDRDAVGAIAVEQHAAAVPCRARRLR